MLEFINRNETRYIFLQDNYYEKTLNRPTYFNAAANCYFWMPGRKLARYGSTVKNGKD